MAGAGYADVPSPLSSSRQNHRSSACGQTGTKIAADLGGWTDVFSPIWHRIFIQFGIKLGLVRRMRGPEGQTPGHGELPDGGQRDYFV
jgi:hypothetical protein